ncbi:hypothetical protein [Nonomuraea jabiensis]|uniref:hypothetical protein n=1 Tax=Nonomuraea jabiensis TaxID=882448 RepID=UPI003D74D211
MTPPAYMTTLRSCHDQPGHSYVRAPLWSVESAPRLIRRNRAPSGSAHCPPSTAYSTAISTGVASHSEPTPAAG